MDGADFIIIRGLLGAEVDPRDTLTAAVDMNSNGVIDFFDLRAVALLMGTAVGEVIE